MQNLDSSTDNYATYFSNDFASNLTWNHKAGGLAYLQFNITIRPLLVIMSLYWILYSHFDMKLWRILPWQKERQWEAIFTIKVFLVNSKSSLNNITRLSIWCGSQQKIKVKTWNYLRKTWPRFDTWKVREGRLNPFKRTRGQMRSFLRQLPTSLAFLFWHQILNCSSNDF